MTSETTIKDLTARYLGNLRSPDIMSFVEQLFQIAAENGSIAGGVHSEKELQFSFPTPSSQVQATQTTEALETCLVEHELARTILRMICARLGVLCKEYSGSEFLPYGNQAILDYPIYNHTRWNLSFTNTPETQEFLIEAL